MDNVIKLTRELYRKLDIIARQNAGTTIEVRKYKEMGGNFAETSIWPTRVCVDTCREEWREMRVIYLANRIDAGRFHSCPRSRWELNWGEIRIEDIYPFLVWHEVHHLTREISVLDLPRGWYFNGGHGKFLKVNEIRADRFAWEHISPEQPMPLAIHEYARELRELERFRKDNLKYFPDRPDYQAPKVPLEDYKMIPKNHYNKQIPWARMKEIRKKRSQSRDNSPSFGSPRMDLRRPSLMCSEHVLKIEIKEAHHVG